MVSKKDQEIKKNFIKVSKNERKILLLYADKKRPQQQNLILILLWSYHYLVDISIT